MNDDYLTVVGTNYYQPIADLLANMLDLPPASASYDRVGYRENGYAVSVTLLLVAVLESYTSRLHFPRQDDIDKGKSVPDLLAQLFPDLPNHAELRDIFLVRNSIIHNHIWHIEMNASSDTRGKTISAPPQLQFSVNQHYVSLIDTTTRRTNLLGLNASPTSVSRADVLIVFQVVWTTLVFMNSKNFAHTPLAGGQVGFRGRRVHFSELIGLLRSAVQKG